MSYVDNVEKKSMNLATYCNKYVTAFVKYNKNLPEVVKKRIVAAQGGDASSLDWMLAYARRVTGVEKTAAEYTVSERAFVDNITLDTRKFEVLKLKPETVADGKTPSWGLSDDAEHDVVRGEYEGAACSNSIDPISYDTMEGDTVVRDKSRGNCADGDYLRQWVSQKGVDTRHPSTHVYLFTGRNNDSEEEAYKLFQLTIACLAMTAASYLAVKFLHSMELMSQEMFDKMYKGEIGADYLDYFHILLLQGAAMYLSLIAELTGAGGVILFALVASDSERKRYDMHTRMRGERIGFFTYSREVLTAALEN